MYEMDTARSVILFSSRISQSIYMDGDVMIWFWETDYITDAVLINTTCSLIIFGISFVSYGVYSMKE